MYYPVSSVLIECLILSIVAGSDSYGYEISQTVKLAASIKESSLYPILRKLEQNGYLSTYNQEFIDTAAIVDQSDPLHVIIQSTGGDVFKNGEGSTVLTAKCYRGGVEVDASGSGTYTWRKYDKNGSLVSGFNKSGKTLSVGAADVDVKATFLVEVTL